MQGSADPADPADHRSSIWRSPDKNPSETPQLVKEMPLKTHNKHCECLWGLFKFVKKRGIFAQFSLDHTALPARHTSSSQEKRTCRFYKVVKRREPCEISERHLPGRRGKSHLQRGISTFAAGSREQRGAENVTKSRRWTEGNDMLWALIFRSMKWKKMMFFYVFFRKCATDV